MSTSVANSTESSLRCFSDIIVDSAMVIAWLPARLRLPMALDTACNPSQFIPQAWQISRRKTCERASQLPKLVLLLH